MRMVRCHELEGVRRFAPRAEIYARARPSYPADAIAHIVASAGPHPRVLDLGAGTGIATNLMRAQGANVVAVEPGIEMTLAASPRGTAVQAHAETLPFRDRCADLVTAFTAFHWFQPEPALHEIRRVLRAEGRLALAWNDWDLGDAFTRAFVTLMRSAASADFPPEDRAAEVAPLYESNVFGDVQRTDFANVHRLTRDALVARLHSMSYVPTEGAKAESMVRELDALHARFADAAGIVEHRYVTAVFVARPRFSD